MRNSKRGDKTPHVRPIQRVEISESNVKLRMILVVVLLAIASVAIIVGLSSALKKEPGWHRINVQTTNMNCGADFVLNYDLSGTGSASTAQYKKLTSLYTSACEDAFRIFSPDVPGVGTANVYDLNHRPNETVTVSSALYQALDMIQRNQSRNLYLGAVYTEYDRIFWAETEVEAASYDPLQNPELLEDIGKLSAFANDPAMIDIRLLGDNQVKLEVSEAYLAFAKDNEIEKLIDFGWMKNAFIADYLAQILIDNDFTDGYLASYDGFTRNLDTRSNSYAFNVFDRSGKDIYLPAVMSYTSPASIVFLRDYPLGQSDVWHYYSFPDGHIASLLIDPADGMYKVSLDSLISYSADQSCAELLLQMIPVFITDTFSAAQLQQMADSGIHSIWCQEQNLYYTDAQLALELQPQEDISYTKVFAGS